MLQFINEMIHYHGQFYMINEIIFIVPIIKLKQKKRKEKKTTTTTKKTSITLLITIIRQMNDFKTTRTPFLEIFCFSFMCKKSVWSLF